VPGYYCTLSSPQTNPKDRGSEKEDPQYQEPVDAGVRRTAWLTRARRNENCCPIAFCTVRNQSSDLIILVRTSQERISGMARAIVALTGIFIRYEAGNHGSERDRGLLFACHIIVTGGKTRRRFLVPPLRDQSTA
jgi:hypothetical protein